MYMTGAARNSPEPCLPLLSPGSPTSSHRTVQSQLHLPTTSFNEQPGHLLKPSLASGYFSKFSFFLPGHFYIVKTLQIFVFLKLFQKLYLSQIISKRNILFFILFKDFILFFERRREGEREGKKHQCVRATSTGCLSNAPNWGPGLQPRHVL